MFWLIMGVVGMLALLRGMYLEEVRDVRAGRTLLFGALCTAIVVGQCLSHF